MVRRIDASACRTLAAVDRVRSLLESLSTATLEGCSFMRSISVVDSALVHC